MSKLVRIKKPYLSAILFSPRKDALAVATTHQPFNFFTVQSLSTSTI